MGETVTTLSDHLKKRIAYHGPLTVCTLMTEMLFNPSWGAYAVSSPMGESFTTAPEISQIFGELIGLWSLEAWENANRPIPIHLIELGPGRATLLTDLLRTVKLIPEFYQNLHLHLVEASAPLREIQAQVLKASPVPVWHHRLETIPKGWSLIIANEFFDCLPIHQLQKTGNGWRERLIDLDDQEGLRFIVETGCSPLSHLIPARLDSAPEGNIFELSPARENFFTGLLDRLRQTKGALIVCDYGTLEPTLGDTLQALYQNQKIRLPTLIQGADLSAQVDFSPFLRQVQTGSLVHTSGDQREFLIHYGIFQRAQHLKRTTDPHLIDTAVYRLIDPSQMGTLFKVMTIHSF